MGIDASLVYQLGCTARDVGLGGALCTLGVQTIRPPASVVNRTLTAAGLSVRSACGGLYERLGFTSVESVDISDFEGCTHLLDLNVPGVPGHLQGRFDAVLNGGTLEHVFDVRAAFRSIYELLSVGGVVIHIGPADGWMDHGFYQFSPTLLVDYYFANRFEILEARILQDVAGRRGVHMVYPYVPGMRIERAGSGERCLHYMTFRKSAMSTWEAIPQQRHYVQMYGSAKELAVAPALRWFLPYLLEDGIPAAAGLVSAPR